MTAVALGSLFFVPVRAAEGDLIFLLEKQIGEIPGLSIDKKQITRGKDAKGEFLEVHGQFIHAGPALVFSLKSENDKIAIDDAGNFTAKFRYSSLPAYGSFVTIDSSGIIQEQAFSVVEDLADYFEHKSWHAAFGAGGTYLSYTETGVPSVGGFSLSARADFDVRVFRPDWKIEGDAQFTMTGVPESTWNAEFRLLRATLRVSKSIPWIPMPWTLTLAVGAAYSHTFVTNELLGFNHLVYPQFYPTLHYQFSYRDSGSLYLKYMPAGASFSILNWVNREIGGGLSWQHLWHERHASTIHLEVAHLARLPSALAQMSLFTVALYAGYRF